MLLLLFLLSFTARLAAAADEPVLLPHVPSLPLLVSSHATAAAAVLRFHGWGGDVPDVVLIGGLAAQMYRCDCERNLDYWDVAGGSNGGGGFISLRNGKLHIAYCILQIGRIGERRKRFAVFGASVSPSRRER